MAAGHGIEAEVADRYHHGNLHEALVKAAEALIAARGVHALSLRGVAREAGVSQAAPYHHFRDKEALLAEVSRRGFNLLNARLDGVVGEHSVDRMRAMGRVYIAFALDHPALYRLMFGPEVCRKEDHPELIECSACTFDFLTAEVARGQANGQLSGTDPMGASMGVWSTMHGLASLLLDQVAERKELKPEVLIESTLDFVFSGLGPR